MLKARAILGADDETVVSVSEHDCRESACCGARTVILVMRPDQPTDAVKLDKPLESVTEADLSNALAALPNRRPPARANRPAGTPTRLDW